MKRKIITLLIISTLTAFPLNIYAATNNMIYEKQQFISTPRWTYTETVTITVKYNSISAVPDTYYYEYYNNNVQSWMRGTLKLQNTTVNKNGQVTATYSGTLYSSPL